VAACDTWQGQTLPLLLVILWNHCKSPALAYVVYGTFSLYNACGRVSRCPLRAWVEVGPAKVDLRRIVQGFATALPHPAVHVHLRAACRPRETRIDI
jgi:hypothetical protein